MITYAIIEDNIFAREHLNSVIGRLRPDWRLLFSAGSIETAADELVAASPDLLFMDIELSDGQCFELFEATGSLTPVIFTTSYDNHTLNAFKVNAIDYLLKPITADKLLHAVTKFEVLYASRQESCDFAPQAATPSTMTAEPSGVTSRILTVEGDRYNYINLADIAYFVSEDKYVFAHLHANKRKMISITNLSDLEQILPTDRFFRLSRGVIASIDSIVSVSKYFRGRLLVRVRDSEQETSISVSPARRDEFLHWLGR